ncbi:hypothetical protein [Nostoc sp. TCL26-01]|uniref:hypothetical protein n=1 Tax=Nostoc sp. TCL26-01 TaxID=2576904 RepID=UPI0015C0303E|nr:hypothetical protein [Nostoc sp. TCL26-01]QLE55337.1 BrnA antitoxin family protein [Nostoc sp. TCL26-01]
MNQKFNSEDEDELRDEYDFTRLPVVARGRGRKQPNSLTIELESDVAEIFPDSASVNEALRFLIRITKSSTPQTQ